MHLCAVIVVIGVALAVGFPTKEDAPANVLESVTDGTHDIAGHNQIGPVLLRLRSTVTICFHWQGVSPQMVNLFHDSELPLTINALLEGQSGIKENDTNLLLTRKLGLRLNGVRISIQPDAAFVMDDQQEEEVSLQLPLKDTEAYDTNYKGVIFSLALSTPSLSILSISHQNVSIVVEAHYPRTSPSYLKLSIPKLGAFEKRNIRGIMGSLWRKSWNTSIEASVDSEDNHGVLAFQSHRIPVVRAEVSYEVFNKSVGCWYVSDLSRLIGNLRRFRVESLV